MPTPHPRAEARLSALLLAWTLWTVMSSPARATPEGDCWEQAGAAYQIHPYLLAAIAKTESGFNPRALNHNANGTHDIGLMQINSLWLPELARHGIREADLWDPCTNLHVGAWLLHRQQLKHGNTWESVGRYHSANPGHKNRYARRVHDHLQQLRPHGPAEQSHLPGQ